MLWTVFTFFRQQCTAEKMRMRGWDKCKNMRKEKYEEENGCSGEDELRKVSVQVRRRSTPGPSLRCITHLLSFFALSFLLKIVKVVAPMTMNRGIFIGQ